MLFLQEDDKSVLPKQHRHGNNICAVLYDQLTEVLTLQIYKPLTTTNVKFRREQDIPAFNDHKGHILDHLSKNNYPNELNTILTKHLTLSILSDQVNFLYESISCAQRGKMTVAYSLLRKPFKDELFILESLYVNPEDFLQRFYHDGVPSKYDPSKRTSDERKAMIRKAIESLDKSLDKGLFNPDRLYEFRYDKDSAAGISGFTDHAIHIVTTNKSYQTSHKNLNFVFSRTEDIARYWQHYYFIVPYLLLYTAAIVDGIVFKYMPGASAEKHKFQKSLTRLAGFFLWLEKCSMHAKKKTSTLIKLFEQVIKLECKECKQHFTLDSADFELFFYTKMFICQNCFASNSIGNVI